MNTPEDDALDLVNALFADGTGSPQDLDGFELCWDSIDEQMRAVHTLVFLLGSMLEHESVRRGQPLRRVVNQMRSDIAGDRYAEKLGIEPRD